MSEVKKIYYTIKEVQDLTGIPASTLRYWETQFDALVPHRNGHGNRYYTEEDINYIKQIRYLRDEMHITSIETIKKKLQNKSREIDQKQRTAEILTRLKDELLAIRSQLT